MLIKPSYIVRLTPINDDSLSEHYYMAQYISERANIVWHYSHLNSNAYRFGSKQTAIDIFNDHYCSDNGFVDRRLTVEVVEIKETGEASVVKRIIPKPSILEELAETQL